MSTHLTRSALLAFGFGMGCAEAPRSPRPNVVLICLDTVRADHLGCYGYRERLTTPFLDRLAERAIVFEDASATAGWTKPSVPSFFTGTFPMQHGVYRGSARDEAGTTSDVLPERATTLAELFRDHGYQTAAFVKNAQLRKGLGFEQGFDQYRDQAGDAREIRWRARDWLEERDPGRPFFLYLHFLDAHWPYPVPEEYVGLFADPEALAELQGPDWRKLRDAVNDGQVELGKGQREALVALYDGALRYIDDQLALLWKTLEREGLARDTVICVVSDHGEEFGEHGKLGHGHGLWENLLRVPWILAIPGGASRRVSTPVSLVDLLPTLAGTVGIDSLPPNMGVDRRVDSGAARPIFAEHLEPGSYQQSLKDQRSKIWRVLRATREAEADGPNPNPRYQLAGGGRWEARVVLHEDGGLHATRIVRSDDPVDDPDELKGPVEGASPGHLTVCGVPVLLTPMTEIYGESDGPDGAPLSVEVGMLVKAKGSLDEKGTFVARRLKLYAADAKSEREVRGRVEVLGDGRVRIAAIEVALDPTTEIRSGDPPGSRLDRHAVLRLLDEENGAATAVSFAESGTLWDLERDPRELEPTPMFPADAQPLRRIGEAFGRLRLWGDDDRAVLSEQDLRALREIGYAE